MIKRFNLNEVGIDYVVGDIHGCYTRLQQALDKINFNPEVDRLFSVGDLVDRGPESELSLEWLEKPWFHAVRGNHDEMVVRWPNGRMDKGIYAMNGGSWMIAKLPQEYQPFADAFSELPLVIEVETPNGLIGIIHAECLADDWNHFTKNIEEYKNSVMWGRERITKKYSKNVDNIHCIYVGHTPLSKRTVLGNHIYTDTGAVFGGEFTIEKIN